MQNTRHALPSLFYLIDVLLQNGMNPRTPFCVGTYVTGLSALDDQEQSPGRN
jgi:hypothetical protein